MRVTSRGKTEVVSGGHPGIVSRFAHGFFGLATGYRLRTLAGIALYVQEPPGTASHLVPGVLETWWYPKPVFLVYQMPQRGTEVVFRPGEELALLLPTMSPPGGVRPMLPAEAAETRAESDRYDMYLRGHGELRWTSAEGHGFSRMYRLMAHRNRVS